MATELSVHAGRLTKLEQLEEEIRSEAYEAFYYVGERLAKIKRDKLYEEAGFKSWSAYCQSGRIEYKTRMADQTIAAAELRPKLPGAMAPDNPWTERQIRELLKCETTRDAIRVAKKAITRAKRTGSRVSAELIAQVRDGDDETAAASKRQRRALEAASLDKHLEKLADIALDWRESLEQIDLSQWDDLPPECMARVVREVGKLYDFLRS